MNADQPGSDSEHDMAAESAAASPTDVSGLGDRKRLAARLLVAGTPKVDIARRLEIDPATLWRWEGQAAFAAYVSHLRQDVVQQTIDAARSATQLALHTVTDAMLEGDANVAIRYLSLIGAARVQIAGQDKRIQEVSGVGWPELADGQEDDHE
jgi:hypothetical protein